MAEGVKEPPVAEQANLTVALRIRPMNEEEIIQGATPVAHIVDTKMVVLMDPVDDPDDILRANRSREKQYMFDVSLDGSASQKDVYDKTCRVLIPDVINGFNATVFAYGATGAGKTHTMLGADDDPGIMAQALNDLFYQMTRTQESMKYKVTMSYLEIYNEMIRDLLNPDSGYLDLREDSKGVQVAGLSEVFARSTEEVMGILVQGNKQRTQEPTAANKTSSRSHAVLQITVRQRNRVRGTVAQVRIGKLFLIDLAGSERAANTLNRGKRMVEGAHINRSLLALGNCINALSDKNGARYVNYRDSKLTRLLKDALGGNCKTVMIAHVSPASIHFEESRNTLVYADRAKNIKTKVRRNVMDVSYHITQYTHIINDLRQEIQRLRDRLDSNSQSHMPPTVADRHADHDMHNSDAQLHDLKNTLVEIFHQQMELRRSLMELNTTAMEISLETTRNQLLIKKWEREHALRNRENTITDNDRALEKYRDLTGQGSDEGPVPEDVRIAHEELVTLQQDRARTESVKANLEKELDNEKEKAAKIEELLPKKVNSAAQQEILSLLCKVHELEIENLEMQSSCLLRQFELRKKELSVAKYEQHRLLCDEIIQQQQRALREHRVPEQKEMEELYELYTQEAGEMALDRNISLPDINIATNKTVSLTTMSRDQQSDRSDRLLAIEEKHTQLPRLFVRSGAKPQGARPALHRVGNKQETAESKAPAALFSQSPKARKIREEQAKENRQQVFEPSNALTRTPGLSQRQQSIITLSSRSNRTTPTPPELFDPKAKGTTASSQAYLRPQEKQEMTSHTRNIAALAARRRAGDQPGIGAGGDGANASNAPSVFMTAMPQSDNAVGDQNLQQPRRGAVVKKNKGVDDTENYLTQSRLAQHDRHFGASAATLAQLMDAADVLSAASTSNPTTHDPMMTSSHPQPRSLYRPNPHQNTQQQHPRATRPPPRAQQHLMFPACPPSKQSQKKRSKSQEYAGYQQLSKSGPRHHGKNPVGATDAAHPGGHPQRRSKIPAARHARHIPNAVLGADLPAFEPPPSPAPTTTRQANSDRGKGAGTKRVKGGVHNQVSSMDNISMKSQFSEPPQGRGGATGKRGAKPTIPTNYRKGDFRVTGFGISGR